MFSKQDKTTKADGAGAKFDIAPHIPTGDHAVRKGSPKPASLISENITIEGSIVGDGELHIDGVVRGDIRIGKLTVGETGHVEGSVTAEAAEIRGRVIGTLSAKQVKLYGAAHVDGDVTHEQLSIEQGAFFQGRSLKFQRPAPAIVAVIEAEAEPKARTA